MYWQDLIPLPRKLEYSNVIIHLLHLNPYAAVAVAAIELDTVAAVAAPVELAVPTTVALTT